TGQTTEERTWWLLVLRGRVIDKDFSGGFHRGQQAYYPASKAGYKTATRPQYARHQKHLANMEASI
ncbi:hypothetical protein, partial [Acidithiobacillus thiooxidans]